MMMMIIIIIISVCYNIYLLLYLFTEQSIHLFKLVLLNLSSTYNLKSSPCQSIV